eukprot:915171-Rhodomonas_salina.1
MIKGYCSYALYRVWGRTDTIQVRALFDCLQVGFEDFYVELTRHIAISKQQYTRIRLQEDEGIAEDSGCNRLAQSLWVGWPPTVFRTQYEISGTEIARAAARCCSAFITSPLRPAWRACDSKTPFLNHPPSFAPVAPSLRLLSSATRKLSSTQLSCSADAA